MKFPCLLLGLLILSHAPAQDGAARLESLFEKVDANEDGKVSLEELAASGQRTAWLAKADTNGDQMADRDEMRAFFAALVPKRQKPPGGIQEVTLGEIPADAPVTRQGIKAAEKYSANLDGHSFLVMLKGEILHESYANGWDPAEGHRLASGTKSFSGALLALGAHDELFSLDDIISETITEWQSDERLKTITVRQLLNLTSGIDPGNNGRVPSYEAAVETGALSGPDEKFRYGPTAFQLFGEFVTRKLQSREDLPFEDPLAYLEARVFEPIGMKYTNWRRDENGMPHLPSGCFITAKEWAKFGQLLVQDGMWEGEALIDSAVLAEATKAVSDVKPGYGLTFWLLESGVNEDRPWLAGGYMAAGAGKQQLYVLPAVDMIVIRQGETRQFGNLDFLDALFSLDFGGASVEGEE